MTLPITETAREPASGNAEWHSSGIPVVIAGAATARLGLHRTAVGYCAAMAALVAVAAGGLLLRRRRPATGQGTG